MFHLLYTFELTHTEFDQHTSSNILNPWRLQGHFCGATLSAYYGKSKRASNFIVLQSPRLKIDLNFYII